jgi:hypothetical protein
LPSNIVFSNLEELTLHITDEWPPGSLRFLSTLIDLSHLNKLSLHINNSFYSHVESRAGFDTLLKLARNIRSLTILVSVHYGYIDDCNIEICSVASDNVKHLTLSVSTVDQMLMFLRQMKHRSSIRFEYTNTYYSASDMHLQWLNSETGYYTYRLDNSSLCLWFDNYLNSSKLNKLIQIYRFNEQ